MRRPWPACARKLLDPIRPELIERGRGAGWRHSTIRASAPTNAVDARKIASPAVSPITPLGRGAATIVFDTLSFIWSGRIDGVVKYIHVLETFAKTASRPSAMETLI
jgi:hypothetical protein